MFGNVFFCHWAVLPKALEARSAIFPPIRTITNEKVCFPLVFCLFNTIAYVYYPTSQKGTEKAKPQAAAAPTSTEADDDEEEDAEENPAPAAHNDSDDEGGLLEQGGTQHELDVVTSSRSGELASPRPGGDLSSPRLQLPGSPPS